MTTPSSTTSTSTFSCERVVHSEDNDAATGRNSSDRDQKVAAAIVLDKSTMDDVDCKIGEFPTLSVASEPFVAIPFASSANTAAESNESNEADFPTYKDQVYEIGNETNSNDNGMLIGRRNNNQIDTESYVSSARVQNENVGAFPVRGPNARDNNSEEIVDDSIDVPPTSRIETAESAESAATHSPEYLVEANLVDPTSVVDAIAMQEPATHNRLPFIIGIVLFITVITVAVSVGVSFASARGTSSNCFETHTKLRSTVVSYLEGDETIREKYGAIGDWCVDKITDFSYLFCDDDVLCDVFRNPFGSTFKEDIGGWNTASAVTMSSMFWNAESFNGNISKWNVSSVTDMGGMFHGATSFNEDISKWNVSSVTDMTFMFYNATSFNGDISNWNVSSVTDMTFMFYNATSFNGDISNWNVSSVTNMLVMFNGATSFNEDISKWNVLSVTLMFGMFDGATSFNGDISNWNVSSVTHMGSMFKGATSFNRDISNWNVSSVTNMGSMFYGATSFNGDISNWNVSSVTDMGDMFSDARSFNGDISKWDVSSVTDMGYMFNGATSFNGDISNWNVSSVTNMTSMFYGASAFNQNLCAWGTISDPGFYNQDIFLGTNCPNTADPDYSQSPPGPFCHDCL